MALPRSLPAPLRRTPPRDLHRRDRPGPTVLVSLLAVLLAACGQDVDPTPSGALPTVVAPSLPSVADGVSQEGVPQLVNLLVDGGTVTGVEPVVAVPRNTPVRLTVLSDTADVLLIKGYDVRQQLTVGEPASVELIASMPGDAAVVLERTGKVLTTLRVS